MVVGLLGLFLSHVLLFGDRPFFFVPLASFAHYDHACMYVCMCAGMGGWSDEPFFASFGVGDFVHDHHRVAGCQQCEASPLMQLLS